VLSFLCVLFAKEAFKDTIFPHKKPKVPNHFTAAEQYKMPNGFELLNGNNFFDQIRIYQA
jgi:hypothetical protein